MNFARDVLERLPADGRALVELARDGSRREWTFGEVSERTARLAGALRARGVERGDVVMTLIGNRPEWVLTMCACMRLGAVALPCTEQLRAKDLRLRLAVARPGLIVADERNRAELEAAGPECEVLLVPDESLFAAGPAPAGARAPEPAPLALARAVEPAAAVELAAEDPCLITFTSGTAGEPKAVLHAQRYLAGQRTQAERWLGARMGELVWCTAASGWSKSARNVFIAPWLRGAAALLHDARFDPAERLELIVREGVDALCMAPTEYRVIAKRTTLGALAGLRSMVAAGEALNPEVQRAWREATGLEIRDGYGQTETGQLTGMLPGEPARHGSMGRALPGVALEVREGGPAPDPREDGLVPGPHVGHAREAPVEGELTADPRTVPTFFLGYLGEGVTREEDGTWRVEDRRDGGVWRTGDRVRRDEEGYLWFEGRADDVIVSAGYRIGPFEVESALLTHPAVAEAAAVAAPDEERGTVVRAVVVLRDGYAPGAGVDSGPSRTDGHPPTAPAPTALARELQEHVKRETAPYKYPRIVEFVDELPKTASGKIKRAQLRAGRR